MNALVIVSADLFGIGIASGHPISRFMMVRTCLFPLLDSVKSVTTSVTILSKDQSGISVMCNGYDCTHAFSCRHAGHRWMPFLSSNTVT